MPNPFLKMIEKVLDIEEDKGISYLVETQEEVDEILSKLNQDMQNANAWYAHKINQATADYNRDIASRENDYLNRTAGLNADLNMLERYLDELGLSQAFQSHVFNGSITAAGSADDLSRLYAKLRSYQIMSAGSKVIRLIPKQINKKRMLDKIAAWKMLLHSDAAQYEKTLEMEKQTCLILRQQNQKNAESERDRKLAEVQREQEETYREFKNWMKTDMADGRLEQYAKKADAYLKTMMRAEIDNDNDPAGDGKAPLCMGCLLAETGLDDEYADELERRLGGRTEQIGDKQYLVFPAAIHEPEFYLSVSYAPEDGRRAEALSGLSQLVLDLAAKRPNGTVRVSVVDGSTGGRALGMLNKLAEKRRFVFRGEIYTPNDRTLTPDKALEDINQRITNVSQMLGTYKDVNEYNLFHPDAPIEKRVFMLVDTKNIYATENAIGQKFENILANAKPCGISLIMVDSSEALSVPDAYAKMFDVFQAFSACADYCITDDAAFFALSCKKWKEFFGNGVSGTCPFKFLLWDTASEAYWDELIELREQVPVVAHDAFMPKPDERLAGNSTQGLTIPLCGTADGKVINYSFGNDVVAHTLLLGYTGCGKTTLYNHLLTQLAMRYLPSEVEVWLFDFKGNGLYNWCTNPTPIVSTVVCASTEDRWMVFNIVAMLQREEKRRKKLFKHYQAEQYDEYREKAIHNSEMPTLPRLLIIIDEYQELQKVLDPIEQKETYKELRDILLRIRYLGMHMLFATQMLEGAKSIRDRVTPRLVMTPTTGDDVYENCGFTKQELSGIGLDENRVRYITQGEVICSVWLNKDTRIPAFGRVPGLKKKEYISAREKVNEELRERGYLTVSPRIYLSDRYGLERVPLHAISQYLENGQQYENPDGLDIFTGSPVSPEIESKITLTDNLGEGILLVDKNSEYTNGIFITMALGAAAQNADVDFITTSPDRYDFCRKYLANQPCVHIHDEPEEIDRFVQKMCKNEAKDSGKRLIIWDNLPELVQRAAQLAQQQNILDEAAALTAEQGPDGESDALERYLKLMEEEKKAAAVNKPKTVDFKSMVEKLVMYGSQHGCYSVVCVQSIKEVETRQNEHAMKEMLELHYRVLTAALTQNEIDIYLGYKRPTLPLSIFEQQQYCGIHKTDSTVNELFRAYIYK